MHSSKGRPLTWSAASLAWLTVHYCMVLQAAGMDVDLPDDSRHLRNQFNFCERAAQTFTFPMRDRATFTEPAPTATVAGQHMPVSCLATALARDFLACRQKRHQASRLCMALRSFVRQPTHTHPYTNRTWRCVFRTCAGSCCTREIFDEYCRDFERQRQEEASKQRLGAKKVSSGTNPAAAAAAVADDAGGCSASDAVSRSNPSALQSQHDQGSAEQGQWAGLEGLLDQMRILDRMINQNTFADVAMDFKYWDDTSDPLRCVTHHACCYHRHGTTDHWLSAERFNLANALRHLLS